MVPTVEDFLNLLNDVAPFSLAEEWDNCGLQVGSRHKAVKNVCIALDPLPEVVAEACNNAVDLLITHHPLFLSPLKRVDLQTAEGKIVEQLLTHRTSLVSVHTNFDACSGGLNDFLCQKIGLSNLKALQLPDEVYDARSPTGIGRIGELSDDTPLEMFVERIKRQLSLKSLRTAGKRHMMVRKVAVCTGSGSGMMRYFFSSDAQVFLTGDLKYHDARAAEARGAALIDVGHFASEHIFAEALEAILNRLILQKQWQTAVCASKIERDPFELA